MLPWECLGALRGPVTFTGEVPVKVRWNFGDLLEGEDAEGVLVSTDARDPEVLARVEAGERVIEAPSRQDPVWQAREVMSTARSIGEWERGQTHESLLPYLAEEAGEYAEAVRSGAEDRELVAELGDVLLQVLFHAEIASRRGDFTLDDVAASFVEKMRSRAPYLFDGTRDIVEVEEQERLWAAGKAREATSSGRG